MPRGVHIPERERSVLRKEAKKLYEAEGDSIREVAKAIALPYTTTRRLLEEAGVEFHGRGGSHVNRRERRTGRAETDVPS